MSAPTGKVMMMGDADRIPVVIGAGEVVDRPADPVAAQEPAALMAEALGRAAADAGAPDLLGRLDSLDIVNSVSWPYGDLPAALAARLPARPARMVYGPVGGESPVRFLHEAALRIAAGESRVAAVVGAEATHAVAAAARAGVTLPWTAPDPAWRRTRGRDFLHPLAVALDVADPVSVYPFYENASAARWGQTPAEAHAASAALWSRFSAVAADNPTAWIRRAHTAEEIATTGPANRPIAFPYSKLMVANPMVNQGGAILLADRATARAAGVAEDRMIHLWGGAAAVEPRDYLQRDQYVRSHAQEAVLDACAAIAAEEGAAGFAVLELYSCFPCVPKMAGRHLGLPPDAVPTTTGGLTFFGAPLNTYMTHAAAGMVRALRDDPTGVGLLYGQGEFVTKHHAVVLAARPPRQVRPSDPAVQRRAVATRGPVPPLVEVPVGSGTVESFTILYGRDGAPRHGVVILRLPGGGRGMARVPGQDAAAIGWLACRERSPIGMPGVLRAAADGLTDWRPA